MTESRTERLARTLKSYINPKNLENLVKIELNEKKLDTKSITTQYDKVSKLEGLFGAKS